MRTRAVSWPSLQAETALVETGARFVAGVDEVGRGSWAGPLVAAAVVLPVSRPDLTEVLHGVRDSKRVSIAERERLFIVIRGVALAVGVGWATRASIDSIGLGPANRLAMCRAVSALRPVPDAVLVDHMKLNYGETPCISIPKGDARSLSIASASIIAKVFRDRYMVHLDCRYPGYGFGVHKGYGTPAHRASLAQLGTCAAHRLSFRPFILAEL